MQLFSADATIFFFFKKVFFSPQKVKKKNYKSFFIQLFVRLLKNFQKNFKFFFAHKKLKKTPSKVAQKNSNPIFFPYCSDCPNGTNRRIHVLTSNMWLKEQLYIELGYYSKNSAASATSNPTTEVTITITYKTIT